MTPAGAVILALIAASIILTPIDAARRDWTVGQHVFGTPLGWGLSVLLLWPVFFPVYLLERRKAPVLTRQDRQERAEAVAEIRAERLASRTRALPPPGWLPDPGGTGERWWDGAAWTEHRRQAGP